MMTEKGKELVRSCCERGNPSTALFPPAADSYANARNLLVMASSNMQMVAARAVTKGQGGSAVSTLPVLFLSPIRY